MDVTEKLFRTQPILDWLASVATRSNSLSLTIESRTAATIACVSCSSSPNAGSALRQHQMVDGLSPRFRAARWVVEGMAVQALRQALGESHFEDEWRQIKLLGELLPSGLPLAGALKGLNQFRMADAHVTTADAEAALRCMAIPCHEDLRERWLAVVDRLAELLTEAAETLRPAGQREGKSP